MWYRQCCPQFSFIWGGGASAQLHKSMNPPPPSHFRSLSSHHTEKIRAQVTVRQPDGLMAPSGNWGRAPDPINKNRLGGGESGAKWEGALARTAAVAVHSSTPNACCMLHGGRPPFGPVQWALERRRRHQLLLGVAGRPGSASRRQPAHIRHGPHTKGAPYHRVAPFSPLGSLRAAEHV